MTDVDGTRFLDMAETYDRLCRRTVPMYDLYQEEMLRIAGERGAPRCVVDLGAGSGILLDRALDAWPDAQGVWIDSSEPFQEVSRRRLGRHRERVTYILASMEEDWESRTPRPVDVVVSMSAIHHLTREEKRDLVARCFCLLEPGGWLLNTDEMRSPDRDAYLASMRYWVRHVESLAARMSKQERPHYDAWRALFARWQVRNIEGIDEPKGKGDDLHESYQDQLDWLADIGFDKVDLFVKFHLWCTIGGQKPPA